MYRPQPTHAGAPWGQPPQQQPPYFPNGDYGQPPPQWQAQQHLEHAPPAQFHQEQRQPGVPGLHGRGQGDELSQRLKEEQRRKQNEYSQALSEQVRQREAQKQHERDARRREDMEGVGGHAIDPATGQPKVERGLFDGLGQTNNNQRGHYGRGRREAPQQQPPHPLQPAPALHPMSTPSQLHQIPPMAMEIPMQQGWSGYSEALGIAEFPPHHQVDPQHGLTPRQDAGPWAPPPTHYQQPQQPQQTQQAPGGAGRRVRNDLHNAGAGGIVDDAQAKRRQQQQLDMQDSLRRQIEEKQRQKQEEKRKREEEERREMEKFEQEKRRQQEEQDRIKEEKRRKALAEEEHFRAQQMQLEAANAAAAHEKELRHQRDQRNRQSPQKGALHGDHPHGNGAQPPQQLQHPSAPGLQKNPFTNSRAHLFQDPPQAHAGALSLPASVPVAAHDFQAFHEPQAHHPHRQDRHVSHQPPYVHATAFAGGHGYNQVPPSLVDAQALMEQYEQVRDELQRQRELVEQLHAQIQQQQQQHRHQREDPRELPTLSDLERLRQELREELEQRETQHRHELASLRKQNQQQEHRSPFAKASPHKHPVISEPPQTTGYRRPQQTHGPRRRHDAFVQDALDEDDEDGGNERLDNRRSYHAVERHMSGNQPSSPVVAPRRNAMPPRESQRSHQLLGSSLSASSLQCESKLVFFDGRVQPTGTLHPRSHTPELIAEEPEQSDSDDDGEEEDKRTIEDDSVDDLLHEFRRSFPRDKQKIVDDQGLRFSNNQKDRESHRQPQTQAAAKQITNAADKPDDDDSLGFFVKRFEANPAEPARYRVSTGGNPPAMLRHVEGDSPVLQNQDGLIEYGLDDDEEEEDDGSLNGEKLEAIFQRNVRRHEILSGFEAQTHRHKGAPEPMHWQQLQQLLRNVPADVEKARAIGKNSNSIKEESLVASSRWMPSSLLH